MASREYIVGVQEALTAMEDAMRDVRAMVETSWQDATWSAPEWQPIEKAARKLATRCTALATSIRQRSANHA